MLPEGLPFVIILHEQKGALPGLGILSTTPNTEPLRCRYVVELTQGT